MPVRSFLLCSQQTMFSPLKLTKITIYLPLSSHSLKIPNSNWVINGSWNGCGGGGCNWVMFCMSPNSTLWWYWQWLPMSQSEEWGGGKHSTRTPQRPPTVGGLVWSSWILIAQVEQKPVNQTSWIDGPLPALQTSALHNASVLHHPVRCRVRT